MTSARTVRPRARRLGVAGTALGALLLGLAAAPPAVNAAPVPAAPAKAATTTPAAINGQLKVCGTKLCNRYGKPIQLRGMSSHGTSGTPGV